MSPRQERWRHLVSAAFQLEERGSSDLSATLVDSALEVFPAGLDPLDDFEGYAVRRFLLALRQAMPGQR